MLQARAMPPPANPKRGEVPASSDAAVKLQFLEGPVSSSAGVSEALGHDQWRIMRRFVIEQGSKVRPIDDGLEAQLNH